MSQWIYMKTCLPFKLLFTLQNPPTDFTSSVQPQDSLRLLTLLHSRLPSPRLCHLPQPRPHEGGSVYLPLSPSPLDQWGGSSLGLHNYSARGTLGMSSSE